ncbi:28S ribosomal protein S29, mitochondrial [Dermatophagoides pteronyssinus]|uniref:Small ribosomal subunit protein mS29 n=1 Tax=Dermatophagoides pteronyssinus TaxID=6956 RepID=A0ABQ8IRF0_DERPT|nr:28S ribosomal protein S29, mitochondrial [Dermatophagoides pteronyssinus]
MNNHLKLLSSLESNTCFSEQQPDYLSRAFFRTDLSNPAEHNDLHHGLFYRIPNDIANRLFLLGGFDKLQQETLKVFQETAIMIRKPALEVIDYLRRTDFTKPPNSYVLYGPIGSGKTFSLNHILHYGFMEKFILINCTRPTDWINWPQEQAQSTTKVKRIDTPLDAAIWLQTFKAQNMTILDELKLTSLNRYTWSQREHTEPGDPIQSIIEHGINRINHASDCMAVLLKELKLNSAKGNCRLMVVVDKANAFYEPSRLRFPDRTFATVDDITIARAFKKLFRKDWQNGAIVASVCKKLVVPYRLLSISGIPKKENDRDRTYKQWGPFNVKHLSDYPKSLLTDQDRQWLQRPISKTDDGQNEIRFLSGMNPGQVFHICSDL